MFASLPILIYDAVFLTLIFRTVYSTFFQFPKVKFFGSVVGVPITIDFYNFILFFKVFCFKICCNVPNIEYSVYSLHLYNIQVYVTTYTHTHIWVYKYHWVFVIIISRIFCLLLSEYNSQSILQRFLSRSNPIHFIFKSSLDIAQEGCWCIGWSPV